MSPRTLIARGLLHYRRSHAAVFVGVLLAAAVLTGALLVGDSVDYTLRQAALARLGGIHFALYQPNRFVAQDLAQDLSAETNAAVAPMLQLRGMAIAAAKGSQANRVGILGVDTRFGEAAGSILPELGDGETILNAKLAQRLGVRPGDEVALRIPRPERMAGDAPLAARDDAPVVRMLVTVKDVLPDTGIGRFSLRSDQVVPFNAFVALDWLQRRVEFDGLVNTLLVGVGADESSLAAALARSWTLEHAGLRLRQHPSGIHQLESDRVFLDEEVVRAARTIDGAEATLAYLVNGIAFGGASTPYSFALARPVPGKDEIVIGQWLADAIGAGAGDTIRVTYYELSPSNEFVEQATGLQVGRVASMEELRIERELMPVFPGLSDVERCRDWDIGMPMDEELLEDEANEAYWEAYGPTPKFLVGLDRGQAMWGNRFGQCTAVRFPAGIDEAQIRDALRAEIDPTAIGLGFLPVRDHATQAVDQAMDFGGLFLGMSLFLIVAALVLTALLFVFGVQQRSQELGTLAAVGYSPRRIRGLMLAEGGSVAILASVAGALAGTAYTRALLFGLAHYWQGALAHTAIVYHSSTRSLATGAIAAFLCAVIAMLLVTWRAVGRPAREHLAGEFAAGVASLRSPRLPYLWPLLSLAGILAAVGGGGAVWASAPPNMALPFFGIGAILLASGLVLFGSYLGRLARRSSKEALSLAGLAVQNMARRRGRSMAVAALLACGTFLVFSVSSMHENLEEHRDARWAGTGGFALFGESTIPLQEAPENTGAAIPIRLRDGDDASCLNLNYSNTPRLLGVDASALSALGAFAPASGEDDPWTLLRQPQPDGVIPALVGDRDTAMWGLKAKTGPENGDLLTYQDEAGRDVQLRLVGALPMRLSVFQGALLVDLDAFTRLYPSESGFRMFLFDALPEEADKVAVRLRRDYTRFGLDVVPAVDRLREFYVVESTYLAVFLVLGAFGLILGAAGMGVVVLRNLIERRPEVAALRALGYPKKTVLRLLLVEHAALLAAALAIGVPAAAVAMAPTVLASASQVSLVLQAALLLLVIVSGVSAIALALALALRGDPFAALRDE